MSHQIPLTQGKFAIVDDQDYEYLSQFHWLYKKSPGTGYAQRFYYDSRHYRRTVFMHREILKAPPDMDVDHRDGDGLNNQRLNLRLATEAENNRNTSGQARRASRYKGVYRSAGAGWTARIQVDRRKIHLGTFPTQRMAAVAYNQAAVKHFGRFARLNDIPDKLSPDDPPIERIHPKTSGFRGVHWNSRYKTWVARLQINKHEVLHRWFDSEEAAARAYDAAAREHLGPKAKLNFPDDA